MKRFRFRLQRVLDARESEEKQVQRRLGEALAAVAEQERLLGELRSELQTQREATRGLVKGRMRAGEALDHIRWEQALLSRIAERERELELAQKQAEEIREELVEVRRRKKVLENLKEKQWQEHLEAFKAQQQNLLDDIGSRSASWKRDSDGDDKGAGYDAAPGVETP
jgi:flagellar FliJ protein